MVHNLGYATELQDEIFVFLSPCSQLLNRSERGQQGALLGHQRACFRRRLREPE